MDDNQASKEAETVKYRRRLDRTPEKHFDKLPRDEKIMLSTLRKALEDAKGRIVRLRDENDEKDDIIDEERRLRQAAEDRLNKYLVDLYNNPEVNSELRQRLPKAKKKDPLQHGRNNTAQQNPAYGKGHPVEIESESEEADEYNEGGSESSEKGHEQLNMTRKKRSDLHKSSVPEPEVGVSVAPLESSPHHGEHVGGHHSNFNSNKPVSAAPAQSTAQPAQPMAQPAQPMAQQAQPMAQAVTRQTNSQPYDSSTSSAVDFSQSSGFQTLPSYPLSHLTPLYAYPGLYSNPLSSNSMSSMDSSYQALPNPYGATGGITISRESFGSENNPSDSQPEANLQETNNEETEQPSMGQPQPAHVSFSKGVEQKQNNALGRSQPTVGHHSLPSHNYDYSSFSQVYQNLIRPGMPTMPPPLYTPPSLRTHYGTDNVSHISRLLAEIATLKKENQEVRDRLKDAKKDIELLRVDTRLDEGENTDRIGALVEEVHAAKKKREEAVKMMLEVAEEDKTAALKELSHMKMKNATRSGQRRSMSESELSEVDDVEDGMTNSSESSLNSSGGDRLSIPQRKKGRSRQYLQQLVSRQREIMKEEMRKVIDQRNEARQRAVKLEKKVSSLELSKFHDKKTDTLEAKLRITEQERDMLKARLQFLMQDISETKLYYNLHKALLSDDGSNDMSSYPDKKTMHLDLDEAPVKDNNMSAEMSKQEELTRKLKARVERAEHEKRAQAEQIEKLEQLIKRQRQKLNALCAGPMLIEAE